ncbi:prepilin [Thermus composti]|uniref:GspH/FimT family protein n=1 Tax=Thermus composti TaxID=532059 RepID=A0ABV6Q262_9DEIN|nr:GspH/FimT family protein [Thermus composti]GGM91123.1 prepilin [Thermus composti]
MQKPLGLTLLELLVLLAILGLLLALGVGQLRSDRTAVNQAAQTLAAQVTRARLEAIRQNEFAGLAFSNAGSGSYRVFLDTNHNGQYDPGEPTLQAVLFGQGDWAQVRLQSPAEAFFVFDSRGIPISSQALTITLANRAGTYTRTVQISSQGRANIP